MIHARRILARFISGLFTRRFCFAGRPGDVVKHALEAIEHARFLLHLRPVVHQRFLQAEAALRALQMIEQQTPVDDFEYFFRILALEQLDTGLHALFLEAAR